MLHALARDVLTAMGFHLIPQQTPSAGSGQDAGRMGGAGERGTRLVHTVAMNAKAASMTPQPLVKEAPKQEAALRAPRPRLPQQEVQAK